MLPNWLTLVPNLVPRAFPTFKGKALGTRLPRPKARWIETQFGPNDLEVEKKKLQQTIKTEVNNNFIQQTIKTEINNNFILSLQFFVDSLMKIRLSVCMTTSLG